jgi:hypothetical protein
VGPLLARPRRRDHPGMGLAGCRLRTLLVAACGLITLATSPRAESVWVLWAQSQDPWGALATIRLAAWPSREACEQERDRREKEPAGPRTASYSCLPATADPSGPKEK